MVFAVAGAAVKLTQSDAEKIEAQAGKPIEEMNEEELQGHMDTLGIEEQEVTDTDVAALEAEGEDTSSPEQAAPQAASSDYTQELEKLSSLHDQGILTDEEFEAKKKEVLGL
jgi:hypothetical protein